MTPAGTFSAVGRELLIRVMGHPIPKGSLKCVGRAGRHRLVEDNPLTEGWRHAIADVARSTEFRVGPHEPVGVTIASTLPRPASHYGAHGLRPNAPPYPTNLRTGDVDKLARLVLDALADAEVLDDDAQVVEVLSAKTFVGAELPEPGVLIRVYPVPPPTPDE
jgi:Holliday junction resolvase RusA-like endonuclease